jgi:hypothetical protein
LRHADAAKLALFLRREKAMTENLAWQPSAAYLYVLHLDAAGVAWEYLRRNPDYRNAAAGTAQHWGLSFP